MEPELIPISPNEVFHFSCGPTVSCFNECCRDLNQFLTPYDILRLKTRLGLSSAEFLQRYTVSHIGPETGLPVMVLTQDPARGMACPFVRPEGCGVYEDRPSSCRMYPLARLLSRSRETGRITEHFGLLKEPHCRGFTGGKPRTPRQWMEDQGLTPYNAMNDRMLSLISLKNLRHPHPLDIRERHLFHLALYDLDAFRTQVYAHGLLKGMENDRETPGVGLSDDAALLALSMAWIEKELFAG